MADMVAREGATSARRRRERQLHVTSVRRLPWSWRRRVEAPGEGVEHEKNVGLRAQKPPLLGKRPGLEPEPEPRVRAVTVGHVAASPGGGVAGWRRRR